MLIMPLVVRTIHKTERCEEIIQVVVFEHVERERINLIFLQCYPHFSLVPPNLQSPAYRQMG